LIQPGTSSGSIAVTAGTQVVSGPGLLTYAQCVGGSAAGTVTIYDGTSTSGLLLVNIAGVPIGTTGTADISSQVVFNTGLFVVVAGTGSTGCLHYVKT
jgi:hypothetical protein